MVLAAVGVAVGVGIAVAAGNAGAVVLLPCAGVVGMVVAVGAA